MTDTSRIHAFLRDARVPYTVIPHPQAYTAQEEAAVAHVPGREWAKVVILVVDDDPVQAVLPAPLTLNLDRLVDLARGREVRLSCSTRARTPMPSACAGRISPRASGRSWAGSPSRSPIAWARSGFPIGSSWPARSTGQS